MSYSSTEKRRVFLACRPIFTTGENAQVRKQKRVRKIVDKHRKPLRALLADFGEDKVVEILRGLLEKRIFESEVQARAQFPDLYCSSPAQNVRRVESENDAAREIAELLDEIESVEGRGEEVASEVDSFVHAEDAAPVEAEARCGTSTEASGSSPGIPTLYPLYFSYSAQHTILNAAQRALEECCFEFAREWLPEVLDSRGWDCAAAVELTNWLPVIRKHANQIPAAAITLPDGSTLTQTLSATHRLRHAAVHRLPTPARELNKSIQCALALASALQDSKRAAQFDALHAETESKIRAMELHKNALEDTLRLDLESIAARRKELDRQEAACIDKMLADDRENKALIARLLAEFVPRAFGDCGVGVGAEQECSESCTASDEEGTQGF
ncbi:hypothetical protein LTR70_009168 [Exophiala xenobiotica]|uniref:Ubiquinol-cytochrome-c reductase cytochrome c1 n=1 Tax=Lithohypha guttulata TaxID=1690604 RepID=A0ABR0KA90_9EURO|nr:hypothetical protein LTR24_004973 [Lithohypha guttulata]KAK5310878.1 hypothetical protein LTR70_009168 [Exophiala xenobiotica]